MYSCRRALTFRRSPLILGLIFLKKRPRFVAAWGFGDDRNELNLVNPGRKRLAFARGTLF
jgi:hypothetical protein